MASSNLVDGAGSNGTGALASPVCTSPACGEKWGFRVRRLGNDGGVEPKDLLLGSEHASCPSGEAGDLRDSKDDGKCAKGITLDEPNVDVKPEETVDDTGPHYPVAVARIEPRA